MVDTYSGFRPLPENLKGVNSFLILISRLHLGWETPPGLFWVSSQRSFTLWPCWYRATSVLRPCSFWTQPVNPFGWSGLTTVLTSLRWNYPCAALLEGVPDWVI